MKEQIMAAEQKPVIFRFEPNAQGCTVKFILRYKMETGQRRERKTNVLIPIRYIKNIRAFLSQELIYSMDFFQPISDNPFFTFFLNDCREGEQFVLEWTDTDQITRHHETVISWYVPPESKSPAK